MNRLNNMIKHYMPYIIATLLVFSVVNFHAFASDDVPEHCDTADQMTVKNSADTADQALSKDSADELRSLSDYQYEDDTIKVVATLTDDNALSDEAKLTATKITNVSRGFNYQAYMHALNKDSNISHDQHNTMLYDISFTLKGKKVEPDAGKVKLKILFKKDQLAKDLNLSKGTDLKVIHFKDNKPAEMEKLIAVTDLKANQTSFTTGSLSVIALENTVTSAAGSGEIGTYADAKTQRRVKEAASVNQKLYAKVSGGWEDPGYGVIAENYYQTGDTESNVCVDHYYSTVAEVGDSSNYSKGAGNIYIGDVIEGSVNEMRPHNAPANIYLGQAATRSYHDGKWRFDADHVKGTKIHENVTSIHPMSIINEMCAPYDHLSDYGQPIYTKTTNAQGQPEAANKTIDLRDEAAGTYIVTYNGSHLDASQYGNQWLNVYLNKDQHLVIYCSASDLTIKDYNLNGQPANNYAGDTMEADDWLTKAVTFYAPNASRLSLPNGTCGVFLAPQATLYKDNTCAGIMAIKSAGTLASPMHGEWHYHNHDLPVVTPDTGGFKLTKKLGANTAADSHKSFKFKITLKNVSVLVGNFGDADFHREDQNCVAYVTLKANETRMISDLPVNTEYSIEEVLSGDDGNIFIPSYTIKKNGKEMMFTSGKIGKDVTDDVTCTNSKKITEKGKYLTIIKYVKGNQASTTKDFTFTISFAGHPDLSKAEVYVNGHVQSMNVKSGMTVQLKDGDKIKIDGLPENIKYQVSEDADGYTPSYVISNKESNATNHQASKTGTMTLRSSTTLTFTNTRSGIVVTGLVKQHLVMWPLITALVAALIYTMKMRTK